MDTNTANLAAAAADLISDRLREMLMDSEELPEDGYDTTLARRDGDALVVELVELAVGAVRRSDGRPVLRISIEAVG